MNGLVSYFRSVLGAAAVGVIGLGSASAEEWRMASQNTLDSPEGRVFVKFAEKVAEYSGGDLTIKLYPNEQLGKQEAVMEQLKLGAVQIYATGSVYLQKYVPDIRWISIAFMMDDRDHWVRFVNTPLVQSWYKQAEEDSGIAVLGELTGVMRGPYRVLISDYEVKTLEDVAKLKLRLFQDQTSIEVWQELGAETRVLGWAETYEAISRGIVNGVTAPIADVEGAKFYEVAPYIMRTNEFYQSVAFMMNKKQFDELPEKDREALLKAHADAVTFANEEMARYGAEVVSILESKGAIYSEPDLSSFIEKVHGLYAGMEERGELPAGLLQAVEDTREP